MTKRHTPTSDQWGSYARAFEYFNRVLFDGELPTPILSFSRKSPRTLGFFAADRWQAAGAAALAEAALVDADEDDEDTDTENDAPRVHEISLNPDNLSRRTREETASTLVHEMVHLWRAEQPGKQPRGGYHCKVWGAKMEEIGLMPSSTGAPGGRKTGQQMTHYIIPRGPFAHAMRGLPEDCLLPFVSAPVPPKEKKKRNKVKYTCPKCSTNVWGKPELSLVCAGEDLHEDGEPCYFEAEESEDD